MQQFTPESLRGKRHLVVGGKVYDLGSWIHPGPFLEPLCNGEDQAADFDKVHDRARLKGLKCVGTLVSKGEEASSGGNAKERLESTHVLRKQSKL